MGKSAAAGAKRFNRHRRIPRSAPGGPSSANLDASGYMLGGQIGCDYQFASDWVLGVEGAAAGGKIGGSTVVAVPGDNATFKETTDFLSSATARVGYAWDRWLLYVKGGAAWAGDRYSVFDVLSAYDAEGLETRFGWTVGAGIEWALWNDWSVKLEYDYYGFGHRSVTFIDNVSGTFGPVNVKQNIQVVKLGLNFHVFAGQLPPHRIGEQTRWTLQPSARSEQRTMHVTPTPRTSTPDHEARQLTIGVAIGNLGNSFRRGGPRGGRGRRFAASRSGQDEILRSLPRAIGARVCWILSDTTTRRTTNRVLGESVAGLC